MPVLTKIEKLTTARNVVQGLKKRYEPGAVLRMLGADYARDDLIALFEEQIEAIKAVDAARAAWQEAILRERALRRRTRRAAVLLRSKAYDDFGAPGSRDFGWDPPKPPGPKTLASKMAGVEKRAKKRARS